MAVTHQIVCDGDSITFGYGLADPTTEAWPARLAALINNATWSIVNKAVSGQTLSQMEADASTDIDPLFNGSYSRNIVICMGGTNDFYGAGNASVAVCLSRLQTYCANRQAAGWEVWVCTMLPFDATFSNFPVVKQTNANQSIGDFNSSVRLAYLAYADVLVDFAADSRIGDAGDWADSTYYQSDGVHPKAAGDVILAAIAFAAWSASTPTRFCNVFAGAIR